jgi:hypothetical protein
MLGGLDAFWWALRWGAPASARSHRSHPFNLCRRWFAARGILRAVKVDVVWDVDAEIRSHAGAGVRGSSELTADFTLLGA